MFGGFADIRLFGWKVLGHCGRRIRQNLRHDQFEKVQGYSFTNIDRFSTGSIITRLTTDVTNLQNAYSMIIRMGVRAPIMVIVAWIFSFRISPSISLVFLACIPVLAIGLCGLAVLVHPVFERVFHTYDKLNNVVDENLQGIRVVKSYNRETTKPKSSTAFPSASSRTSPRPNAL